jgi:hypothetical protein
MAHFQTHARRSPDAIERAAALLKTTDDPLHIQTVLIAVTYQALAQRAARELAGLLLRGFAPIDRDAFFSSMVSANEIASLYRGMDPEGRQILVDAAAKVAASRDRMASRTGFWVLGVIDQTPVAVAPRLDSLARNALRANYECLASGRILPDVKLEKEIGAYNPR